jgi:hypothetical protein
MKPSSEGCPPPWGWKTVDWVVMTWCVSWSLSEIGTFLKRARRSGSSAEKERMDVMTVSSV